MVPVILPHGTQIHVGQVICYKCGLLSSDGRKGFWMSSSPSLHINKDTGVALAVNPGSALVYYNVSATVAARADVSVVALETVDIIPSPSEQRFVTNAPNAPALTIPVSLGGQLLKRYCAVLTLCCRFDGISLFGVAVIEDRGRSPSIVGSGTRSVQLSCGV